MTASYKPAVTTERAARAHPPAQQAAAPHAEHPLVRLQRRAGNAAVARLLESGVVAREAAPEEEELAQASHDHDLQRQEMPGEEEEEELAQADHDDQVPAGSVGLEGGPLPDTAAREVDSLRGTGSGVNDGIRTSMESALGVDLSGVRVHQDAKSDSLARSMTARAFTTGSDVFLRGDVSASDPHLMAHELTHVAQQAGGPAAVQGQRMTVGAADDPLEREADRVADAVTSGSTPEKQEA